MPKKQPSPKVTAPETAAEPAKKRKRASKLISQAELCLTREEAAAVHTVIEMGPEKASVELGMRYGDLSDLLKLPHVQAYMQEYRGEFIKQMARRRARNLTRKGITKDAILERAMDLANTDPSDTKGTIDGQVKALKLISDVMGLGVDDGLKDKSDAELEEIVTGAQKEALNRAPSPTSKVQ